MASAPYSSENLHCRCEVVPTMYLRNNFIKTSCSYDVNKCHSTTMIEDYHNFFFTHQNGTLFRENTQHEVKNGCQQSFAIQPICAYLVRHPAA